MSSYYLSLRNLFNLAMTQSLVFSCRLLNKSSVVLWEVIIRFYINRFNSKNDGSNSNQIFIIEEKRYRVHDSYSHTVVRFTISSHFGTNWTSGRCWRSLPLHEKLRTVQEHVRRLFRRWSLCKKLLPPTRTSNSLIFFFFFFLTFWLFEN